MIRAGRRWLGLACVLAACLWPARARAADPAGAQDEELSLGALLDVTQEVWAATRTAQKNSEAPASITTVTREQIALWGYRSVAEVLGHLLGFYVIDDHTSANLAVRGISGGLYAESSIVKVLVDGHSVAFHSNGGNWLGPELLPLSAIERIEIVRGPASALFGADAFLGLINIRTRSGAGLRGAAAWLTVGRAGHRAATDVDVSAGLEQGPLDLMVAYRRTQQDLSGLRLPASSPAPSLPEDKQLDPVASGLDQGSSCALARLTYRPAAGTELGAFAYHSSMRRGAEFGSLYQLVHGTRNGVTWDSRVSQSQSRAGLFLNQTLGQPLRLSARGQLFQGGPGDDNRLEVGSAYYYVRRRFGFRGADLEAQAEWTPGFSGGRARLVAGADTLVDDELLPSRIGVSKQPNASAPTGEVIETISVYQGHRRFFNSGAYLQAIWNPLDDLLSVTGGVRYDRHNVYGGQVSERVGLVSNPWQALHAKLLYGSAFKAPSPLLLHAVPSALGDVVGNPQLKPQHVRTVELEVGWQGWRALELTTNLAYSVLWDKTEFVQQGISQVARNVARAATLSWESSLEYKFHALAAHLSLEAQRTQRRTGQAGYADWLLGSSGGIYPNLMVHGGLVGHARSLPLRGTLQASLVGARRPSDTNILLNDGAYHLPAYLLLEAGIATRPFDLFGRGHNEVSFSLTGKNLLDSGGPVPGFSGIDYPLAPRAFFLQASFQ
jgi:iron complex outermembrane receptor protein